MRLGPVIERLSANDLMELASDVGPLPAQVAGVIVLEDAAGVDPEHVRGTLAARLGAIPRLRQRLVRPPLGCGRPYWAFAPAADPLDQVSVVRAPWPGGEPELLAVALDRTAIALPPDRPLWAATYVTGLAGGRAAVVLVMHHVLADGMSGLAVLSALVDGPSDPALRPAAAGASDPTRSQLVVDAWRSRWLALHGGRRWWSTICAATRELGERPRAAPRTSVNRASGTRRHATVVRRQLAPLLDAAHASSGTLNDVVLTAVAAALGELLAGRGEPVTEIVASVPVSGRASADAARLGNDVGVMPVRVPTTGPVVERLGRVRASTQLRKQAPPASSAALLQPVFRAAAATHLLRPFVDHQRLVNTFVTNLRGPQRPVHLLGAQVSQLVVLGGLYGNVTAAFAALSYAGTLAITVLVDPDAVPDHATLARAFEAALDEIVDQRWSTSAEVRPPDRRT
jgi:diacylglycerol O-acyltransferase / wax synthase